MTPYTTAELTAIVDSPDDADSDDARSLAAEVIALRKALRAVDDDLNRDAYVSSGTRLLVRALLPPEPS